MKKTSLLPFLLSLSAVVPMASAQTLVNDSFADGDRTTQNLPSSMAFLSGAGSSTLTAAVGSMTWGASGSGRTFLGYFGTNAAGTTPASLAVGQSLTAQFTFSLTGTPVDSSISFRMGLFDSTTSTAGTQRVSADSFGNSNAAFAGYTGYGFFTNPGGTTNALRLYERTNTASTALTATSGDYTQLGSSVTSSPSLSTGVTYTGTLIAARTGASQMDLTLTITGGSLSGYTITQSDTSGITSQFDTIAFGSVSAQTLDYTFNSFNISVVPEPSTSMLMFGGLGLLVLLAPRRLCRQQGLDLRFLNNLSVDRW